MVLIAEPFSGEQSTLSLFLSTPTHHCHLLFLLCNPPKLDTTNQSPHLTSAEFRKRKENRGNEKREEKPKDVVHVRARRGQATSLAERIIMEHFMVCVLVGSGIGIMMSDAQWRNFRANLPILTVVFGIFTTMANMLRAFYHLKAKGMSIDWLLISLAYLLYLHGACIIFVLSIAVINILLVKIFGKKKYFPFVLWGFNISILICNRV